jgi:hypothetical protein
MPQDPAPGPDALQPPLIELPAGAAAPPAAAAPAADPKRKAVRPGFWSLAGWLAVGTAVMGTASVPWLASEPIRLARIANALMPELNADITIGRASIGWSGPIVIEDIHVLPRTGGAEPVSIARIEGSHGLLKMLLSLGDLGTFRVQGVDLHIIYRQNRTSNLAGLFTPRIPSEGTEGTRPGRRLSPIRVRLEIEDAIARVDGPWSPEQWVSDPIDAAAALAPSKEGPWSEWRIEPVQLLSSAELKPSVAQGILAYIAPVLAEATRTAGLFSLRLDGGVFPVGDPAAGSLSGVLSMHAVDLGPGPLVKGMIDSLPMGLRPPPSIRIADDANVVFRLQDRLVWHEGLEFGLPLAEPGRRIDVESSGTVALDDGALDLKLVLPLPVDMPAERPVLQALAGKSISLGVGGVLGSPKVIFDGSIRAVASEVIGELLGRPIGGNRPRPLPAPPRQPPGPRPGQVPATPTPGSGEGVRDALDRIPIPAAQDPAVGNVIDLVGGVLDEVARRRAERAAVQQDANPQPTADGSNEPAARPRRPLLERIRNRRNGVQP